MYLMGILYVWVGITFSEDVRMERCFQASIQCRLLRECVMVRGDKLVPLRLFIEYEISSFFVGIVHHPLKYTLK